MTVPPEKSKGTYEHQTRKLTFVIHTSVTTKPLVPLILIKIIIKINININIMYI